MINNSTKCVHRCSCRNAVASGGPRRPPLTPRQREVIVAWLRYGTKELAAQELFVTHSTVKTHIQRIRERYIEAGRPASTKFALFVRALQDNIIDLNDDAQMLGLGSDLSAE